jgi:LuxR family maltose regulon positive regulatory protein
MRLRVLILRALLADAQGDRDATMASLAAAVVQAEPEGVIRPFLDEGAPMAALLADLRAGAGRERADRRCVPGLPRHPARRLPRPGGRAAPARAHRAADRAGAGGAAAAGDRTVHAEMAADLFVEPSTVKTHLIHLYSKLGVHSRTQAVARARTLQLLD